MPRSQGTSRKGKPKAADRASGMGRALAKAQTKKFVVKSNGSSRHGAGMQASGAHDIGISSEGEGGMIKSVLEMDSLSDFILQAQMANREYNVEREQFLVLDQVSTQYDPHAKRVSFGTTPDGGETKFDFSELSVPRRPKWDTSMTTQDLEQQENEAFLQWRRAIAAQEDLLNRRQQSMMVSDSLFVQSSQGGQHQHHPQQQVTVTPFEKNIQVWKQLWRVLEQSACLIQIVDARHPLFYFSNDLQKYATDELGKPMIILLNKSDFLTSKQRTMWHTYLTKLKIYHIFFSAKLEQDKLDRQVSSSQLESAKDTELELSKDETSYYGHDQLLTRSQLHDALRDFAKVHQCRPTASTGTTASRYGNRIQFGMVGFPNVGKSSVINVLVGSSKHTHGGGITRVGVASQPGKTKHFQTVLIPDRDDIMLCDCPGLVFPSFVSSTADLIAAGVYPIDQMRDIYVVMELLTERIRLRDIWNIKYGITLPLPLQNASTSTTANGNTSKDEDGFDQVYRSLPPPTAREVLDTYCISRSLYAASSGIPDHQTAARTIIKDYVKGKLLYCHPPPSPPQKQQDAATTSVSNWTTNHKEEEAEFIKETLLKELEAELRKNSEHHGSATTNARAKVLQSLEANARLLSTNSSTKNAIEHERHNNNNDMSDTKKEDGATTTTTSISPDVAAMVEDDLLLLDTIEGLESLSTKGNKKASAAAAQKKGGGGKGKQGKRDRIKARKQQGNQSTMYFSSSSSSTPVGAM